MASTYYDALSDVDVEEENSGQSSTSQEDSDGSYRNLYVVRAVKGFVSKPKAKLKTQGLPMMKTKNWKGNKNFHSLIETSAWVSSRPMSSADIAGGINAYLSDSGGCENCGHPMLNEHTKVCPEKIQREIVRTN